MKKRNTCFVAAAIAIMIFFSLITTACMSPNQPSTPAGTDTVKNTEEPESNADLSEKPEPSAVITEDPGPTLEPLDVPYYSYDELLEEGRRLLLGNFVSDGYWEEFKSGNCLNRTDDIPRLFPNAAVRERDEHCRYYIVETDNDSRLFFFADDHNDFTTICGYPILTRGPLPYEAFAELGAGDPIEAVVSIDPSAELARHLLLDVFKITQYETMFEQLGSFAVVDGNTVAKTISTLHYLSDGVLRIDYTLNENKELVIAAMTYGADWKLANAGGVIIDYRILSGDLDF